MDPRYQYGNRSAGASQKRLDRLLTKQREIAARKGKKKG